MKEDFCSEDRLSLLKEEHRELDKETRKLELRPSFFDSMRIKNLKRQKLRLKERIEGLR